MLSTVAVKSWGGRALAGGALAATALGALTLATTPLRVRELRQPASIRAPWVVSCASRMDAARLQLVPAAPEMSRAGVLQAWSQRSAWAQLSLAPQYSARIEYRPGDDSPSVFDWEEAPTPVAGSFALHRRVGHFDLTVVADDSDERGLQFAARMQPLLDACLMEAQ